MKKPLTFFILLLAIFVTLAVADDPAQIDASGKFNMKILYAGLPKTDRAKDFMDFLGKHFKEVTFTDYNSFDEKKNTDFDVLILDHDGKGTRATTPKISRQFSRATVTMGVPGGKLSGRLNLKTGYL
jgi:hypothetical protein